MKLGCFESHHSARSGKREGSTGLNYEPSWLGNGLNLLMTAMQGKLRPPLHPRPFSPPTSTNGNLHLGLWTVSEPSLLKSLLFFVFLHFIFHFLLFIFCFLVFFSFYFIVVLLLLLLSFLLLLFLLLFLFFFLIQQWGTLDAEIKTPHPSGNPGL